ncbi:DUF488 domain-containing protein [Tautonia sociabilis]|uniref:DUF488 domain-containing protein n=1 Tax=Tautonia sociabilis TaxID=2080755 RepID=A0A432MPS7_9BACT|nr:DUF488 domain-containing protein [Tautonia sociabilis]RUL89471.1 DUF488 domain-containing protein [Tautonia sociabilis]
MPRTVFTIGHSNHRAEQFIALLQMHGITALGDVRSKPYSQFHPQFNRESLKKTLREHGIAYVFLGQELGARSEDHSCYEHGKVQYDRLARTELFRKGLDRILKGTENYRIALMCAEKEPLECHRTILVARSLESLGLEVRHIHADGRTESHAQALSRLIRMLKLSAEDMFGTRELAVSDAYRIQADRIAYQWNMPAREDGRGVAG